MSQVFQRTAVSFTARLAGTKWTLSPPFQPPLLWKKLPRATSSTAKRRRQSFVLGISQGVDMCNSYWKHFRTLQRFLQDEFLLHLSRQSQSDLEFFKSFTINHELSPDWQQTNPWDVNLPVIMVFLSCSLYLPSFLFPFSLACLVPLFPSGQPGM